MYILDDGTGGNWEIILLSEVHLKATVNRIVVVTAQFEKPVTLEAWTAADKNDMRFNHIMLSSFVRCCSH